MTTDLVPKTAFAEVKLRRGTVRMAGMTKGSGMIQPLMATTLGFVLTDAQIPRPLLRAMLKRAVERSYNRLSVDGDTSTNDTLLLLANGASGVRPDPKEMPKVEEAVAGVMESLAQAIARDGEGAQKFDHHRGDGRAERRGRGAHGPRHRQFAAGEDGDGGLGPQLGPHPFRRRECRGGLRPGARPTSTCKACWCAAGPGGAVFRSGTEGQKLDAPECEIRVNIRGKGKGAARFWTCDLTEGYIRINASYRT